MSTRFSVFSLDSPWRKEEAMPRIPDELIERIKAEVPVKTLAERAGVDLRSHGENLIGLCVFHPDRKTPNLVLTPAKNVFHCFACGASGSPIDWVMRMEGVRVRAAIEILLLEFFPSEARRLGIGAPPKRSTVPKLPSPFEPESSKEEIARAVVAYYHERLKETPDAMAFLQRRGLDTPDVIEGLHLGFSDRSLGLRLPLTNRKAGQEIRAKLQELGVYRASGHEHLVGCVVAPFFDEAGEVRSLYGRRIEAHLTATTPKHLYTAGPHEGLLNRAAFESEDVILCEAPLDAATFYRWSFRNVTTSYGVEGFTDELLSAFVSHGVKRCFIAYDRDEAGDRGAGKVATRLMAEGIECYRVLFPKGMDANEYALKVVPGDKSLGALLRGAEWMGSGPGGPRPTRGTREDRSAAEASAKPSLDSAAKGEPGPGERQTVFSAAAPEVGEDHQGPATKKDAEGGRDPQAAKEENRGGSVPNSIPESSAEVSREAKPSASAEDLGQLELRGDDEVLFRFEDRSYRVTGLKKALRSGSLHATVHAERHGDFFAPPSPSGFFLDRFDFVSAVSRGRFEKQAAQEMGVKPETVKWDLGRMLRRLEELQHKALQEAMKPRLLVPEMSEEARQAAMAYAIDPALVERLLSDYERCGVVGEAVNKLVGLLGAVSRLLPNPLAIIVRSSSAAGKTALMDAILRFIPKESREKYSALSGHALFYFEGKDFKHKILAIVEEEGASRASYALKLLQSEGEITIASTGKDPGTGKLVTQEYRVEGPVMIFLTTTEIDVDDELLNRAIVLTVDEGREQTRRIHQLQRESQTLEALFAQEEREEIYQRQHDLQRLLRPIPVVNPYVRELTFLDDRTRTRRDHTKYLRLIESIALLFQHQRPLRTASWNNKTKEYIEVTLADIALANRLASEVLGRSLDELPPQSRRLLMLLDRMVREGCERHGIDRADFRFTLRDVREATTWSHDQLWRHLQRLVAFEYVIVHRGGRGQTFVYELLYDGQGKAGERFVIGLADVEALARAHDLPVPELPPSLMREAREDASWLELGTVLEKPNDASGPAAATTTTPTSAGQEGTSAGVSRAHSGAFWVGSAGERNASKPASRTAFVGQKAEKAENAHLEAGPGTHPRGVRTHNGHRLRLNLLRFPPAPRPSPAREVETTRDVERVPETRPVASQEPNAATTSPTSATSTTSAASATSITARELVEASLGEPAPAKRKNGAKLVLKRVAPFVTRRNGTHASHKRHARP
jgi:hypothetical protein